MKTSNAPLHYYIEDVFYDKYLSNIKFTLYMY